MRDVLERLMTWWDAGESVAVGTVVATFDSAPRPAGCGDAGRPRPGSRSAASRAAASRAPSTSSVRRSSPRASRSCSGTASATSRPSPSGLTCGGIIDIFVERIDRTSYPELAEVAGDIAAGRPVAVATVVAHPDPARVGRRLVVRPEGQPPAGSLGSERADDAVVDDARGLLENGRTETLEYGPDGQRRGEGMRVFVSSYAPVPRLLVFGAIDFAAAVARLGSFLGYRVTVCDARPVFATASRFPSADEVIVDWPHRYLSAEAAAGRVDGRTVICVLTHDPKFDVPLLEVALRLPDVAYIGAMGSRRTHDDRLERLREAGLTDAELDRLASPIGLDLGARTPEETAVSIAAEIIAQHWGGAGDRLSRRAGRIHH